MLAPFSPEEMRIGYAPNKLGLLPAIITLALILFILYLLFVKPESHEE